MSVNVFTVLVVLGGLFCSSVGAIYLQLLFCLFAAAEAVGLPALGGASVNPAVLFMPFMVMRASFERPSALRLSRPSRAGFVLMLFAAWGALSAALLPRLFYGETMVMAINRGTTEIGVNLSSLKPVSGNLTQPMYAIGGAFTFLGMTALLARKGRLEVFRDAALTLAAANVLAGFINVGEFYLGLPSILEYVRTAGYAQFGLTHEGALYRIQGTFPETSAFSGFTLPLFAFATTLWIGKERIPYSGWIALLSLLLLLMSTSGTAYVGLVLYLSTLGMTLFWRARASGKIPHAHVMLIGLLSAVVVVGALFVLETPAGDKLTTFFELTVANKLQSESGVERASWNAQAWINFLETFGLGIGLGTARTSSLVMALLSNVGVIGTVLFVIFIALVLRSPTNKAPRQLSTVTRASQQAIIASLLCAVTSGSTCDMGVAFYVFAAAAAADPLRYLAWPPAVQRRNRTAFQESNAVAST